MSSQSRKSAVAHRCLECKERKIKCDGALPICQNCKISHRRCRKAPAFELSWPKGRSRRALEVPAGKIGRATSPRPRQAFANGGQRFYFVNVLSDYVADNLAMPRAGSSEYSRTVLFGRRHYNSPSLEPAILPKLPSSLYADMQKHEAGGSDWISYFYYEASTSLPQLDGEPTQFRDLLLRMSLKDDSASSRALLYSVFCLSAVRRYGNVQECAHFKALALRELQLASGGTALTTAQALQHVATGLMLCRSEIELGDEATVFWAMYICNLRTILNYSFKKPLPVLVTSAREAPDAFLLFRYVHYHDTLAQFSLDHWRRPSYIFNQLSVKFKGKTLEFRCTPPSNVLVEQNLGEYIHSEIYLLAAILAASKMEHMDTDRLTEQDKQQKLARLETNLNEAFSRSRKECHNAIGVDEPGSSTAGSAGLETQRFLFLSASWIYFQRACRRLSGPSVEIDSLLDEVSAMANHIRRMGIRVTPFSLFMLGSEARTEKRRRFILDLIHQSPTGTARPSADEHSGNPSTNNVDVLLSAVWAQDDLHDSSLGYLDYATKMEWVITARPVLPAFV